MCLTFANAAFVVGGVNSVPSGRTLHRPGHLSAVDLWRAPEDECPRTAIPMRRHQGVITVTDQDEDTFDYPTAATVPAAVSVALESGRGGVVALRISIATATADNAAAVHVATVPADSGVGVMAVRGAARAARRSIRSGDRCVSCLRAANCQGRGVHVALDRRATRGSAPVTMSHSGGELPLRSGRAVGDRCRTLCSTQQTWRPMVGAAVRGRTESMTQRAPEPCCRTEVRRWSDEKDRERGA